MIKPNSTVYMSSHGRFSTYKTQRHNYKTPGFGNTTALVTTISKTTMDGRGPQRDSNSTAWHHWLLHILIDTHTADITSNGDKLHNPHIYRPSFSTTNTAVVMWCKISLHRHNNKTKYTKIGRYFQSNKQLTMDEYDCPPPKERAGRWCEVPLKHCHVLTDVAVSVSDITVAIATHSGTTGEIHSHDVGVV